jgi:uncharacterized protein (TIGR02284 family)
MAMIETLKKLHAALVDTEDGYEEALEEDGESEIGGFFRNMIALRQRDLTEIEQLLTARGEEVDDEGSFVSVIQRAVVDVRSSLTGLDKNALPSFIHGEETIVGYYDDAIEASAAEPGIYETLTRQKRELENKIAEMKLMDS